MAQTPKEHTMRTLIAAVALAAAALPAAADIGVSIGINQPGFHGQLSFGDYGSSYGYNYRPIVVAPRHVYVRPAPVYTWAPPVVIHRHWSPARHRGHDGWDHRGRHDRWDGDRHHGGRHGDRHGRGH
jgi:hypothetical protein